MQIMTDVVRSARTPRHLPDRFSLIFKQSGYETRDRHPSSWFALCIYGPTTTIRWKACRTTHRMHQNPRKESRPRERKEREGDESLEGASFTLEACDEWMTKEM